jgi:hypothetical protein
MLIVARPVLALAVAAVPAPFLLLAATLKV